MIVTITLLSVVTLMLWGLSDYLAGRSGRQLNAHVVNFVFQAVGLLAITPVALLYGMSFDNLNGLLVLAAVAALFTLAYVYHIKAMSKGPAGVAAPIANSYAVVTLAASLVFFDIALSAHVVLALLLVVAGALFISSDRNLLKGKVLHSKTVKLALVPLFAWGLGFALLNGVVDTYAWHEILFSLALGMTFFAAIVMFTAVPRQAMRPELLASQAGKIALLSGLFVIAGSVAFFVAADIGGQFVIPAVIAAASPLITSLAAYVFDNEKLSRLNRLGAILTVIGIALLNV